MSVVNTTSDVTRVNSDTSKHTKPKSKHSKGMPLNLSQSQMNAVKELHIKAANVLNAKRSPISKEQFSQAMVKLAQTDPEAFKKVMKAVLIRSHDLPKEFYDSAVMSKMYPKEANNVSYELNQNAVNIIANEGAEGHDEAIDYLFEQFAALKGSRQDTAIEEYQTQLKINKVEVVVEEVVHKSHPLTQQINRAASAYAKGNIQPLIDVYEDNKNDPFAMFILIKAFKDSGTSLEKIAQLASDLVSFKGDERIEIMHLNRISEIVKDIVPRSFTQEKADKATSEYAKGNVQPLINLYENHKNDPFAMFILIKAFKDSGVSEEKIERLADDLVHNTGERRVAAIKLTRVSEPVENNTPHPLTQQVREATLAYVDGDVQPLIDAYEDHKGDPFALFILAKAFKDIGISEEKVGRLANDLTTRTGESRVAALELTRVSEPVEGHGDKPYPMTLTDEINNAASQYVEGNVQPLIDVYEENKDNPFAMADLAEAFKTAGASEQEVSLLAHVLVSRTGESRVNVIEFIRNVANDGKLDNDDNIAQKILVKVKDGLETYSLVQNFLDKVEEGE